MLNSNSIKNTKKRKDLIDQYSNSIKNKIKSTFSQTKVSTTKTDKTSNLKPASTSLYLYNINYDNKNINNNINNNIINNSKLKSTSTKQDLVNRLKNKSSALKFSITSKNYYINIKNNKNQNVNSFQLEEESYDKNNKNNNGKQDITKGINILSKFDTFVHDIKNQQKEKSKFNKTTYNYYFDKSNNLKNTKSFDINHEKNKIRGKAHIIIDTKKNINKTKEDIIQEDKNENNNKENDKNIINIKNDGKKIKENADSKNEIKLIQKEKDIDIENENNNKNEVINEKDYIKKKEAQKEVNNDNNLINNINENNKGIKEIQNKKEEKQLNNNMQKEEKSKEKKMAKNDIKNEEKIEKNIEDKEKEKKDKENKDTKDLKEKEIEKQKNEINYESPLKKSKSKKKKKDSKNKSDISPIIIQCKPLSPNNNISSLINEDIENSIPSYFSTSNITDVQIPKDYLNIIYYNLLNEEKDNRKYFKAEYNYMNSQNEINEQMRSILVDWIIDVHGKFGFCDETLYMTVLIIDRYSSLKKITRNEYQCLGITALMIACKHEEINVPKVEDFIYITDNAYNKEEVFNMEIDILDKLNYNLLYPSPIKFFEYLSLHFGFDKQKHFLGKYLMETFLLNLICIKFKPSIISCACTYIVMKFFKMKNYKESYSKKWYMIEGKEGFNPDNGCGVKDCAQELCNFVDNINSTNYLSCQKKYSSEDYCNISKLIINYPENNNKTENN